MKFYVTRSGMPAGEIYHREVTIMVIHGNTSEPLSLVSKLVADQRELWIADQQRQRTLSGAQIYEEDRETDWVWVWGPHTTKHDHLHEAIKEAFYQASGSNGQLYSAIRFVGFGQHTTRVEDLFYALEKV